MASKPKGYYIYSHWTESNELFYIGVGKERRAWDFNGRNENWKKIKNEEGCEVFIIVEGFSNKEEAYKEELRLQLLNKPKACKEYGGGSFTLVFDKTKKLQSQKRKGEGNPMFGKTHKPETKLKISKAKKGKAGRKLSKKEKYDLTQRNYRPIINCRGEVFNSLKEAFPNFGLKGHTSISQCLNGKQETAGRYPDGKKVKWEYYYKGESNE